MSEICSNCAYWSSEHHDCKGCGSEMCHRCKSNGVCAECNIEVCDACNSVEDGVTTCGECYYDLNYDEVNS